MADEILKRIATGLAEGRIVPYLGPDLLRLDPVNAWLPTRPEVIAERLSKRAPVPSRLRRNMTAAAQYIENFRHRKVLRGIVKEIFSEKAEPTPLHHLFAAMGLPLIVDTGYDAATASALATHRAADEWGQVQAVSRADVKADVWTQFYDAANSPVTSRDSIAWQTLLYKPLGAVAPEANFLISDSDFVEVLTEIDIQTPIPDAVQARRTGRGFLFLGCRFGDQLARTYARQVIKRSGGQHFAVIDGELSKNEERFLSEQGIQRIDTPLDAFSESLHSAVSEIIAGPADTAAAVPAARAVSA